jgi:hypothetical protein
MLRELVPGVSVVDHAFSLGGMALGLHTTVLSVPGGLVVHAPGPLSEAEVAAIRARGEVRAIVAPNLHHHLFVAAAKAAFPEARVFAPEGLRAKLPVLDVSLENEAPAGLRRVVVEGAPGLGEHGFFHEPSRTLVLTDLVFHIAHSDSLWTRIAMTLNGGYGKLATTRVGRSFAKDKKALRSSADELLALSPENLIVAHGEPIVGGAETRLREALAWIPR